MSALLKAVRGSIAQQFYDAQQRQLDAEREQLYRCHKSGQLQDMHQQGLLIPVGFRSPVKTGELGTGELGTGQTVGSFGLSTVPMNTGLLAGGIRRQLAEHAVNKNAHQLQQAQARVSHLGGAAHPADLAQEVQEQQVKRAAQTLFNKNVYSDPQDFSLVPNQSAAAAASVSGTQTPARPAWLEKVVVTGGDNVLITAWVLGGDSMLKGDTTGTSGSPYQAISMISRDFNMVIDVIPTSATLKNVHATAAQVLGMTYLLWMMPKQVAQR